MSVWAYECRPPGSESSLFVPRAAVDEMPPEVSVVRVKVGNHWICARIDRTCPIAVEGLLIRQVVASDAADCPECAESPAQRAGNGIVSSQPETFSVRALPPSSHIPAAEDSPTGRGIQAAAIALQGVKFVIVLVGLDLVENPGEAAMAIEALRPRFGGVPVVLLAQRQDGSPVYFGEDSVPPLADIPIDKMPWKTFVLD